MSLKRDSQIGKYIIRERLAGGGMGVVYRARDAFLGREVALKTILADKATDKGFLSRFEREARSIAQIEHPNIVSLIEFVRGDPAKGEISFMVMEYLKGKDLGKLIKEDGPLEITRAIDRMLEVCSAVDTCHRRGFLHRDLKPTNIFITTPDPLERAKVLDFGVAKMWADSPEPERHDLEELTKKGFVFGTPEYLAPELLRGKPATPKADQYALGVVLYTALTGKKPFVADPKSELPDLDLWQAVAKGNHRRSRELRAEIPQGLEDTIERAMHLDPAERFHRVHDFGAGILEWASEAARHRWSAHFTGAPPVAVDPQVSIAIDASQESTIRVLNTGSTLGSRPDQRETRPVGTDELRAAAGLSQQVAGEIGATTRRQDADPTAPDALKALEQESVSVSIDVADDAPPSQPASTGVPPRPRRLRQISELVRRPAMLVVAGTITLGIALVIAVTLSRSKTVVPLSQTPPPGLIEQSAKVPPPAIPAVEAPLQPAVAAASAPPPPVESPAADAPPPMGGTAKSEIKRSAHRHRKAQTVDQKGFPIPTD